MEDAKIGAAFRAVRTRNGRTQASVAEAAGSGQSAVSRLERGRLSRLSVETVRRIARALDMWVDIRPRWRGIDLDRILNGAHSARQEALLLAFERYPGWAAVPEVSYAVFGERGAVDILAWHQATRSLLVIELKTALVDPAELVRSMDQRRRLASRIARTRGWDPATVSTWVVLTDTRTNRRRVASHAWVLAPFARIDGRRMRAWLQAPKGAVSALSFWLEPSAVIPRHVVPKRRPTAANRTSSAGKDLDDPSSPG
jgi:transcriptional regulator with XRE-family HTH domain